MFARCLAFLALAVSTPALAATELTDQATGAVYILGDATEGKVTLTSKADGQNDAFVLSQKNLLRRTCHLRHRCLAGSRRRLAHHGPGHEDRELQGCRAFG